MTGSRFLVETLKGFGVTHAFYMPMVLTGALVEMEKLGIRRIMTHSEKAAAYMADGYARAAQRASVCVAQNVGAANLAAGLQDAMLANSPVVALTGRATAAQRYRNYYQEVEHTPLFAPVTKATMTVENVEQLPRLVRQAFRQAVTGSPGPVHLDLPGNTADVIMDNEAEMDVIIEAPFTQVPPFRPEAELDRIHEALALLARARRPVIVAGGGVTISGAQQEVVGLAERLSIPVATSLNAKGTITDDHPLAVGICGTYSRWCANRVVAEADLVFFIGSHTGSQVTTEWKIPRPGTTIVQLDIDGAEMGRSYPITVGLLGDAQATLRRMLAVAEPGERRREWIGRVRELCDAWRAEVRPLATSDATPIRPERLCTELTEWLPSDSVLVTDTGHSGIWTGTMVDVRNQSQRFYRAAGSLGWAFPAALGVKCALPDRPVICFTGDGGIWYHLAEIETAMRYGINTITVINNNHSLNQEKLGNENYYGGQPGNSDELWVFPDTNFARVAEDLGAVGIRVTDPRDIRSALDEAVASGRPAVIDVVTDINGIAPTAWTPA